jgi:hypothetical protein
VHFRRVVALECCARARVCVFVCARDARGCESTYAAFSCSCSIHSLFAVVVVVCQALDCACMVSLSSCCDLRDRRSVAAFSSGMTASGSCGPSGGVVLGHSRTVLCVSDSMLCADWLVI